MRVEILRDIDVAQQFLVQGLWLQRAIAPGVSTVKTILEWVLEISAGGQPLPPVGVVADFGHTAYAIERDNKQTKEALVIPGMPPGLMRTYEDHVLGKIYADWSFERASDAMRRYTVKDRERERGLAYLIKQFRDRASYGGVEMSPGIIRNLKELAPEEIMRRGWESLNQHGLSPLLLEMYESLIAAARRMSEVLALEDVIALEQRTALADMGQYVAHRQVVQIASRLEQGLPKHKVKPLANRQEVATRVLDEDTYPVGGFTSISTRGSIESLLHSQLAYMEPDPDQRPDMFDIKFLRDELYYYSRDENQFLRRRRVFLFCLFPDLVKARYKDADLPCQRIVMVLGLLLTAVRKMSEWLSTDALKFEFLLIQSRDSKPLEQEGHLLEMLFREAIENNTVEIKHLSEDYRGYADRRAFKSMVHVLTVSTETVNGHAEQAIVTDLRIDASRPEVRIGRDAPTMLESDDVVDCWTTTLERLLMLWI